MKTKKLKQADTLKAGDVVYSGNGDIFQVLKVVTEPVYELKNLVEGGTVLLKNSELQEKKLRQLIFAPGPGRDAIPSSNDQKKGSNPKSPYPGVYKVNSKKNPYQAYINKSGIKWTQCFPTAEEAKAARDKKLQELGAAPAQSRDCKKKHNQGTKTKYKCKTCGAGFNRSIRVCTLCNGDVVAVKADDVKTDEMGKAIDFEDRIDE